MALLPIEPATRQVLCIGAGLRFLAKTDAEAGTAFVELLPFNKAWPLALLLSAWYLVRARKEPHFTPGILDIVDKSDGVRSIWRIFDSKQNAALLEPVCQKAYEAKEPEDIAEAGGAFAFAVQKLGYGMLKLALTSSLFEGVAAAVVAGAPAPQGLEAKFLNERGTASPTASPARAISDTTLDSPRAVTETDLADSDHCSIFLRSQLGITDEATIQKLCVGPARIPFLLIFGGDAHHVFARAFEREVLQSPDIADRLRHFIVLSYQLNPAADLLAYRTLRITAFPTFVVMLRQQERGRLIGYPSYGEFVKWLDSLELSGGPPSDVPVHKVPAEGQPAANPVPPVQTMPVAQGASEDVIRLFAALQAGNLSPREAEAYRETLRNQGYLV